MPAVDEAEIRVVEQAARARSLSRIAADTGLMFSTVSRIAQRYGYPDMALLEQNAHRLRQGVEPVLAKGGRPDPHPDVDHAAPAALVSQLTTSAERLRGDLAKLRSDLEFWESRAERIVARLQSTVQTPEPVPSAKTIRAWAVGRGLQLSDRGRIPAEVVKAYLAAQQVGP